jgi:hypothetical protein
LIGKYFGIQNLAERTLLSFQENVIKDQGYDQKNYRLLDLNLDTIKNVNGSVINAIDSCAKALAGENIIKYSNLSIIFYKRSDVTNKAHLKENPRDIDRYSQDNDMIFIYKWSMGKF